MQNLQNFEFIIYKVLEGQNKMKYKFIKIKLKTFFLLIILLSEINKSICQSWDWDIARIMKCS